MAEILTPAERFAAGTLHPAALAGAPVTGPHPDRAGLADVALSFLLVLCHVLAVPAAGARALALSFREAELWRWLWARPGGAWRSLRRIAFVRLARQMLKLFIWTGAERTVVRRFRADAETLPPGGCVWAIPHSAWLRALAVWGNGRAEGLALAGDGWARRLAARRARPDFRGLRRLVRHLRAGGRAAVAADSFVLRGACEARFLGYSTRVSMAAVRIASAGRVAVVPAWLSHAGGVLQLEFGDVLPAPQGRAEQAATARALLEFFERRIAEDPAQWNDLVPFFRKHARRLRGGAGVGERLSARGRARPIVP